MHNLESTFLIYFIYGLTFFSMGLGMLLEYWRTESIAPQRKLFLPLAIFGLSHGVHEWLELFLKVMFRTGVGAPHALVWIRPVLLAGSFLALGLYSYSAYRYAHGHVSVLSVIGAATLPLFALLAMADVVNAYTSGAIRLPAMVESLIRYLLAVPSAAVATIGLRASALKARADNRRPLDLHLTITALGFALYSVSQLFVPSMNTFIARFLNVDVFEMLTFIPIQVVRAAAAMVITAGTFGATRFMETERQQMVTRAQKARVEALEQQEIMRRDLLRHTVRAQEDERARIARELHDEMAQILTAFSLDLATLQQSVGSREKAARMITRLQDLGKQMSQDIQRMVYDLRPAHLDDLGLVPALKFLVDYESPRLNLTVDLNILGEARHLDPLVETVLYRIAQEGLTNVARHAQTSAVTISLAYEPAQVTLKIVDQGIGFDPSQQFDPPQGWGLAGMRERVESINGILEITSYPGQGTTILVTCPLDTTKG